MVFMDTSTPTCPGAHHGHHLTLGHACLEVANADPHNSLQLWAQAEECYKCPPWYYLTLPPNATRSLVVNSTYATNLVITNDNGTNLYSLDYHFGEYGNYFLPLTSHQAKDVQVTRYPESQGLPLLTAALFYILLTFMWQCSKFLVRRMDSSNSQRTRRSAEPTNLESSPLLSPHRDRLSSHHSIPSTSTSPTASTSSQPPSTSLPQPSLTTTTTTTTAMPPSDDQDQNSSPAQGGSQGGGSQSLPLPDPRRQSGRLLSLDAFRGLAIVLMIFVNYGGGQYAFFKHARWNGLTVADLVFPWFLWIMGVSMVFSIRSQLRRTTRRIVIVLRILKRCIILFALGVIINSTNGHNYMPTFRILGVLQRFSLCYLLTAVIEVYTTNPQESPEYVWYWRIRDLVRSSPQWVYTLVLVTIQVALTLGMPVPGCPMGYLGPGGLHDWGMYKGCTGGVAGYIDRVVLGRAHVYSHPSCASVYASTTPYDPEGLLGVLTSVLMVQFGASCGRIILTYQSHRGRMLRWLVWALVTGLMAGLLCGWRKEGGPIPINKNLWSLSFVLCTTSFAFLLFTAFYALIDDQKFWSGNPLRYAGMNSIVLYFGHEVFKDLLPWSWKPVGQHHANHLVMNLWATSLWVAIAYLLHRKKLYVSV